MRKQLLEQIHTTHYLAGIHRNTQIIVVIMEMYLVRKIKKLGHGHEKY